MALYPQLQRLLWVQTLWLGTVGAAFAQTDDGLQLSVKAAQTHENNLFRLSDSANVKALTGRDSASERIGTTTLGLGYHKAYSLQRLELDVSLVDYRYQSFDYLSFTARNYTAAWRWSFTPRLHGSLTSDRKETLNSFSDYAGTTLITQRNQRTDTSTGLDAIYELVGPWRLLAGLSQQKQVNEQGLLADSDYSANSAQIGGRYDFASGSNLAYSFKASSGSYLNRALSASSLTDDGFDQTDSDVRLLWMTSGKVTANLNAGYVRRTHPHFSQRDYSGINTGANVIWALSGKTALSAEWTHRLGSFQTNYSNYSRTDKLSLGPTWQISPKTVVGLRHEVASIDYLGTPMVGPSLQRQDTTRDTALTFVWQPTQSATINASLKNATRSSTLAGADFSSRQATISASYSF